MCYPKGFEYRYNNVIQVGVACLSCGSRVKFRGTNKCAECVTLKRISKDSKLINKAYEARKKCILEKIEDERIHNSIYGFN